MPQPMIRLVLSPWYVRAIMMHIGFVRSLFKGVFLEFEGVGEPKKEC